MTAPEESRRRVAVRLLLLEALLLGGILGAFALVAVWRVGTAPLETLVALGAILMAPVLGAEWVLVRMHWKRLETDFGRGRGAP